jgi:hypothetical protein
VVEYAADVLIFVNTPEDTSGITDAISCYDRATDVALKVSEIQTVVVGTSDIRRGVLDIP